MNLKFIAIAALAGTVGLGAAAVTIQPLARDFGKIAVRAYSNTLKFSVEVPGSAGRGDTVTTAIAGPDAADFALFDSNCNVFWRTGRCELGVLFSPKSIGQKVARLEVTDSRGGKATAALTGTGVAPLCTNRVVFCNYAHLYSGTFRWGSNLTGPKSSYSEQVTVTVAQGVGTCNGTATRTFEGRSVDGSIIGPGLVAVEFVEDIDGDEEDADRDEPPPRNNASRLVYRVTVACPSPEWPRTADGPGTPSRPAELGDTFQETYKQPASEVGIDLVGSANYPSPDSDPLNGVEGEVKVEWSLKRS